MFGFACFLATAIAQSPNSAASTRMLDKPGGAADFQATSDSLSSLTLRVEGHSQLLEKIRRVGVALDVLRTALRGGAILPAEFVAPLRLFAVEAKQAESSGDLEIIGQMVAQLDKDVELMASTQSANGPKYAGASGVATDVAVTIRTFSHGVEVGGYQVYANPRYRDTAAPEAYLWNATNPKSPPTCTVIVGAKVFWAVKERSIQGTPVVLGVGGAEKMEVRLEVP